MKKQSHSNTKKLVKLFENRRTTNDIVYTRADKGNTVIATPKLEYVNETLGVLNSDNFTITKKNPRENLQKRTKNAINKRDSIFNYAQKYRISLVNPQIPKLISLIKLH